MPQKQKTNVFPPVSVSQNFLTSAKTVQRLLRLTSITKTDHVVEIGAGKGHITRELARRCRAVTAYEIDRGLCAKLAGSPELPGNVTLLCRDFLTASLPDTGDYKVLSNIPFSVTTPILRKLTTARNPPREAWLIVEKGAAKRFCGKPFDATASLLLKPFFDLSVVYHFERRDFHPMPSCDAVLLRIHKKTQPDIPAARQKSFHYFIEKGMRYGVHTLLTKKQIGTALKLAGLPSISTSGTMLYVQWLCLFRCWARCNGL